MEVTKMSIKGQITIPVELRRKLRLTEGSKVAFVDGDDGKVYIVNSSMLALKTAQHAFDGEAEKAGISSEEDIVTLIKQERGV
ncbi:MAG: AbrB/MazE/SpoVT family DNA-binding domain-containing protein [Clostridia bacterium]|nr:AbrB/MazE/SpoVT family DNA-binding domain-containing protein [Clostridia bacterium]